MMLPTRQIRLCGFGGQGIILAGTILGHAGIRDGLQVAGSNSYGAAARGGTCRAEVVISGESIIYPLVIKADILVSMSQGAYDSYIAEVEDGGVVLYDSQLVSPRDIEGQKQVAIPATAEAMGRLDNKQVANMVMLGATVEQTRVVTREALLAAVEGTVEPRFRDLNLKAVEIGFKLGETTE